MLVTGLVQTADIMSADRGCIKVVHGLHFECTLHIAFNNSRKVLE